MKAFHPTISCIALIAMITGCGQSGVGNAVPQGSLVSAMAHHDSGSSGDLLYVSNRDYITIVSWPNLHIVGSIPETGSLCSDPNTGNVFVPGYTKIDEYAHGGTSPIATINGPSGYSDFSGCAVDPTTGNLALKAYTGPKGRGALIIFPSGQGTPLTYNAPYFYGYVAYDDAGNLFTPVFYGRQDKEAILELPKGQNTFTRIRLPSNKLDIGKIQWDGTYLVYDVPDAHQGAIMYQLSINNNRASIAGTIHLLQAGKGLYWIHDGTVFQSYWKLLHNKNSAIAAWSYPNGGKPMALLYGVATGKKNEIGDVTVSVAPSH